MNHSTNFLNQKNRRRHKNIIGYWTSYRYDMRYLNDLEINKISQSGLAHALYSSLMKRAVQQDSVIIREIDVELTK